MWGASSQLREVIAQLKRLVEYQEQSARIREHLAKETTGVRHTERMEQFERTRKQSEERIEEMRKEGEIRRQEDLQFRTDLLSSLARLNDVLSSILARLDDHR